jgi:hypothetical protein
MMDNEVEFDESGNVVEPAAGPEHESAENQVEEQDERRAEGSAEEGEAEEQVTMSLSQTTSAKPFVPAVVRSAKTVSSMPKSAKTRLSGSWQHETL